MRRLTFLLSCTAAISLLLQGMPAGSAQAAEAVPAVGSAAEFLDKPVPAPAGGRYEQSVSVSLSSAAPDANIYYTLDGTVPDASSFKYDGTPIVLKESANLSVIAEKDGVWSKAAAYGYIIKSTEAPLLQLRWKC